MGIQGLLPLLKSIQQPISISELAGSTIGVDVYCWLHKGAYGCALELAEGNDTELYVCFYCCAKLTQLIILLTH